MSKEFEEFYSCLIQDEDFLYLDKTSVFVGFNAGMDAMQAKLDDFQEQIYGLKGLNIINEEILQKQVKELESLRGFASRIIVQAKLVDANKLVDFAKELNLLDENRNPTKLLMGCKGE
jgi:hypothetical protein